MTLDDRLLAYEDQQMTMGNDMEGALLVRDARERIAELEAENERLREVAERHSRLLSVLVGPCLDAANDALFEERPHD